MDIILSYLADNLAFNQESFNCFSCGKRVYPEAGNPEGDIHYVYVYYRCKKCRRCYRVLIYKRAGIKRAIWILFSLMSYITFIVFILTEPGVFTQMLYMMGVAWGLYFFIPLLLNIKELFSPLEDNHPLSNLVQDIHSSHYLDRKRKYDNRLKENELRQSKWIAYFIAVSLLILPFLIVWWIKR